MTTTTAHTPRTLLKDLAERFPAIRDCLPLAIGINKQLAGLLPEVDAKTLRTALFHHTSSVRYLKAMEKATTRHDLEGNVAGEVTEEQRQHASTQLKERFRKQAEQKRAEAQQKRAEEIRDAKLKQLAEKFAKR